MVNSALASYRATRDLLDEFGMSAKYELGQNFLVDDGVVGKILELAQLEPTDVVLEVGPGIGTLTSALLPRAAAVVCIEADRDMAGPLSVSTADYSERLAVLYGDATRVDKQQVANALESLAARGRGVSSLRPLPNRWVSNLPYAVAATLVLGYFEAWDCLQDATVMVQSEVADRMSARQGTKTYGAYTVKLSLYAQVVDRFTVPPTCFYPAPHVDSAVVRIERLPLDRRVDASEASHTAHVVDAAFAQRRKTLRNSLSSVGPWSRDELDAAFGETGIDGGRRAETLTVDEFHALAAHLGNRA